MIISGFIVADNPFLDTFRRHVERQMNDPVLTPLGCKDSKFHRIQCASCIASGEICEKLQRIFTDLGAKCSHSFLFIVYCAFQQFFNIFFLQRFQFKYTGTG